MSIALALVFVVLFVVLVLTGKFILGIFNEVYISYYQSYVISLFVLLFSLYSVLFKLHMMIREYQTVMFYMTILSSFFFLISFYAFLYFSFDMLNSFFYAQGLQYFIQLIVSVFVYNLDKKWNSVWLNYIIYYAILDILSNDFYVYIPSCCRHIGWRSKFDIWFRASEKCKSYSYLYYVCRSFTCLHEN